MYSELKGKVAVITGGSKGIGTAIAERFGQEGMKVVINYNSDTAGAEKAAEAVRRAGGEAIVIKAHVGTEEGVQSLVDGAVESYEVSTYGLTMRAWKTRSPRMRCR